MRMTPFAVSAVNAATVAAKSGATARILTKQLPAAGVKSGGKPWDLPAVAILMAVSLAAENEQSQLLKTAVPITAIAQIAAAPTLKESVNSGSKQRHS